MWAGGGVSLGAFGVFFFFEGELLDGVGLGCVVLCWIGFDGWMDGWINEWRNFLSLVDSLMTRNRGGLDQSRIS